MSLRIAIVEDSAEFRQTVELVLSHTEGFELAASFGSVEALRAALADPRSMAGAWSVVLMDLDLPGESGIEGIRAVKERYPGVAVLVCTVFEDPGTIVQAVTAGADGYVLKGESLESLLEQLQVVADGGSSLSTNVARALVEVVRQTAIDEGPAPARLNLSGRERDVLRCLVRGQSYHATADELGVSVHTVRTHIRSLYKKLQVQNVAEAVSKAVRDRLI